MAPALVFLLPAALESQGTRERRSDGGIDGSPQAPMLMVVQRRILFAGSLTGPVRRRNRFAVEKDGSIDEVPAMR
jgi:hypothetical protein